jgi:beta-glucosidase
MKIPPYAVVPYRDPSLTIAERAADLLDRMSVEEKLSQLGSVWVFQIATERGFDAARATPLLAGGIGQITRVSGASSFSAAEAAELANAIQRHLIENTRLGIPAILHEEICSGLMAREAAVFPQALGVAATFRPELNRRLADSVRAQMRAMGAHQGLSPVLDICRDPRWGRLEESYGEDPFLVSQMGIGFITGLQGSNDGRDLGDGVIATAKHFVGYGASEGGMNWAPAHLGERELRDVYLRPFEAAVRDAGLASVMNAYQELDGIPCAANRWLLTDLLRGEWGFDGTVVSDYFAIKQLDDYHGVVGSWEDAAVTALTSGIDIELPMTECYGDVLRAAIERGAIAMADVDEAVRRSLESKLRLGLFERPYVDVERVAVHTRTVEQIELSRQLATDSLVLLRNDGVLPLRPGIGSVAVIGPNAANARQMLGDYSYITHVESLIEVLKSGQNVFAMPIDRGIDIDEDPDLSHIVTVRDALVAALPDATVHYAQGCTITGEDRSGFAAAVEAAAKSDLAVLVMGERSGLTDDCTTGESRDVSSLGLTGVQEDLVHAVAATGTPVVLVLIAGRPVGSPAVHAAAGAVLMAWLPGEQGGRAIVDVLTGEASPGGKLPVTYPRTSGQIPIFYGHKVSGGRSHWKGAYVDESNEPLYPFGHGLGYSTFTIVAEGISPPSAALDDTVEVSALVTNTGDRRADEVVQLYARDPMASVTRPLRELVGFARITLVAGASAHVTFQVPVSALGFAGRDLTYVVEPGDIEFFVGSSSSELSPAGTVAITGDKPMPTVRSTTNLVTIKGAH